MNDVVSYVMDGDIAVVTVSNPPITELKIADWRALVNIPCSMRPIPAQLAMEKKQMAKASPT